MNRKTIIKIIAFLTVMSVILSGCGMFANNIPDLTEEQTELISEYAAETLLHFDKKHGDKIGKEPEGFVNPKDIIPTPEPTPEPTPTPEIIEVDEGNTSGAAVVDNTENVSVYSELEDILGLSSDVDFTLLGYDVLDTYPEDTGAFFVMTASQGCQFVIVKFEVNNNTDHVSYIDIPSEEVRFKIKLNGNAKNALTTMLLNDLISYREELDPGDTEEVVIVAEFDEAEAYNIDTLSLVVKTDEGNSEIIIK